MNELTIFTNSILFLWITDSFPFLSSFSSPHPSSFHFIFPNGEVEEVGIDNIYIGKEIVARRILVLAETTKTAESDSFEEGNKEDVVTRSKLNQIS